MKPCVENIPLQSWGQRMPEVPIATTINKPMPSGFDKTGFERIESVSNGRRSSCRQESGHPAGGCNAANSIGKAEGCQSASGDFYARRCELTCETRRRRSCYTVIV